MRDVGDVTIDEAAHPRREDWLVCRQGAVALEREVAPGQGRAASELPHDGGIEALRRQEGGLHGDPEDLLGRTGGRVDEHHRAVGPRLLTGTGVTDLERSPADRRRHEAEPLDVGAGGALTAHRWAT